MHPDELISERKKISSEIYKMRTKKNITRLEISNLSGLSPMTVDCVETGGRPYSINSYIILKRAIETADEKPVFVKKIRERAMRQYE
jgi:transcriptional regulator with XRE-family HTH domain